MFCSIKFKSTIEILSDFCGLLTKPELWFTGAENCHIKTAKPLPFRWGRTDCIPDSETKWTPYDFEGTKTENHSNAYGTGTQVVKNLKADFNFTAAESISLMALHGIALFGSNAEETMKYK